MGPDILVFGLKPVHAGAIIGQIGKAQIDIEKFRRIPRGGIDFRDFFKLAQGQTRFFLRFAVRGVFGAFARINTARDGFKLPLRAIPPRHRPHAQLLYQHHPIPHRIIGQHQRGIGRHEDRTLQHIGHRAVETLVREVIFVQREIIGIGAVNPVDPDLAVQRPCPVFRPKRIHLRRCP